MRIRPIVARLGAALAAAAFLAFAAPARGDDPKTVDEAIAGVQKAASAGEWEKAQDMAEAAVKLAPKNRQALFLLAAVLQTRGGMIKEEKPKYDMFHKSADVMRDLVKLGDAVGPEKGLLAQAMYNDACYYSLIKKDADQALKILEVAIDAGFSDAVNMAADTDLAMLHGRPEWTKLTERIEGKAKEAKKAMARTMAERDAEMAKELLPKVKDEMKGFKSYPFTFKLPDVAGKTVSLDDYKGKVVIVDLWGTWCPPCRMEIPHFVKLKDAYKDKGFDIVGLNYENTDGDEAKKLITAFVAENKMNYKCLIGDDKTAKQLVPELEGYPTTLFLDKTGKVRYSHVGYAPYAVLEEIVKTLLSEGANP